MTSELAVYKYMYRIRRLVNLKTCRLLMCSSGVVELKTCLLVWSSACGGT